MAEDEQRWCRLADVVPLVKGHLLRHDAGADDVALVVLDPAALHVGALLALARLHQLHHLVPRDAVDLLLPRHLHLRGVQHDAGLQTHDVPLRNGDLEALHRLALVVVHSIRLLPCLPLELIPERLGGRHSPPALHPRCPWSTPRSR